MQEINSLFNPKSIVVVGVSKDIKKLGANIFNNIIDSGFSGEIYPVNPKHNEVYGYKCYSSISEIVKDELNKENLSSGIDLVIYAIPANLVVGNLKEAVGLIKVNSAMVISAGFSEIGEEGEKLEKDLNQLIQRNNITLLGPNCLGFIKPGVPLNASFAPNLNSDGGAYLVSQSGAFCTAAIDIALKKNLGFNNLISYGNGLNLNEIRLIRHGLEDENVKVIGAYVEQISDGGELYSLIKDTETGKPVVIMNPGSSKKAASAIASHTGSLVQAAEFRNQALRQAGAIMADTMEQLFNLLMNFSWSDPVEGKRIAIVTNAGGPGIVATDRILEKGLDLAEISQETKEKLAEKLPTNANLHNPIDVIGDALADRYQATLEILTKDPDIDAILVILTPQTVTQIEETAKVVINSSKTNNTPIFTTFIGGEHVDRGKELFYDAKVPIFDYVEEAIDVIAKMYQYEDFKKNGHKLTLPIEEVNIIRGYEEEVVNSLPEDDSPGKGIVPKVMSEELSSKIAIEHGFKIPNQQLISSADEAFNFAKNLLGKPVVMKVTSEVAIHKTEDKMIYTDLYSEDQIRQAFDQLINHSLEKPLLIQEQIVGGEEVFIGIKRDGTKDVYKVPEDKGFGHLMLFGKGGIYTEVYEDIKSRLLPISKEGAMDLVNSTKVSRILNGARGKEKLAVDKLYELIKNVQNMVISYPEIVTVDLNPIIITQEDAYIVDMKVFLL